MEHKVVYHIVDYNVSLCGRHTENIIFNDKDYESIKGIIDMSKNFIRLCKICARIKIKEEDES